MNLISSVSAFNQQPTPTCAGVFLSTHLDVGVILHKCRSGSLHVCPKGPRHGGWHIKSGSVFVYKACDYDSTDLDDGISWKLMDEDEGFRTWQSCSPVELVKKDTVTWFDGVLYKLDSYYNQWDTMNGALSQPFHWPSFPRSPSMLEWYQHGLSTPSFSIIGGINRRKSRNHQGSDADFDQWSRMAFVACLCGFLSGIACVIST